MAIQPACMKCLVSSIRLRTWKVWTSRCMWTVYFSDHVQVSSLRSCSGATSRWGSDFSLPACCHQLGSWIPSRLPSLCRGYVCFLHRERHRKDLNHRSANVRMRSHTYLNPRPVCQHRTAIRLIDRRQMSSGIMIGKWRSLTSYDYDDDND